MLKQILFLRLFLRSMNDDQRDNRQEVTITKF